MLYIFFETELRYNSELEGMIGLARKNEIPVSLHIKTLHRLGSESEEYVQDFSGKYILFENAAYLRYMEQNASDGEDALVTFKFEQDGKVQLTRKMGQHKLHLYFEMGKRNEVPYHTPFGNVPLSVVTNAMQLEIEETPQVNGEIKIDYQLFNGDVPLGDYKIRLQFNA